MTITSNEKLWEAYRCICLVWLRRSRGRVHSTTLILTVRSVLPPAGEAVNKVLSQETMGSRARQDKQVERPALMVIGIMEPQATTLFPPHNLQHLLWYVGIAGYFLCISSHGNQSEICYKAAPYIEACTADLETNPL